ncbi:hypothetical protein ACFL2O_10545 [Thermodesulfobacteriota bacterium]
MRKILLYIGGSLTLCFSLLHLSFWKIGNWQEELLKITPDNKGIVQMLNVVSIYTLLFSAFVSFYLARKTEFTFIEKTLIIFIACYYLLRVAFGIPFFGFSIEEVVIWIICFAIAFCYLFALRQK